MIHPFVRAIKVLDHGFVKLQNISGPTRRQLGIFDADDTDPANTARMSFDQMGSERTREMDLKLCDYLMRNGHTSPFEMIEVWIEMKMPIFVARQFVRHRTCSINEVSGRYVQLPPEWYIPEVVGRKPKNVKQGQTDDLYWLTQKTFKEDLDRSCRESYKLYESYILTDVAPEHARMFLHLNHYTHWIWKQDLHNLMHFLSLRVDSHAQIEAQAYANAIIDLIRPHLPNSMALFDKYRRRNMEQPTQKSTIAEPTVAEMIPAIPAIPSFCQIVLDLAKGNEDIIADMTAAALPVAHLQHMAIGVAGEAIELLEAYLAGDLDTMNEELGDAEFFIQGADNVLNVLDYVSRDFSSAAAITPTEVIHKFLIASGNFLDSGKRLGTYVDESKIEAYKDNLRLVRSALNHVYAVLPFSKEKAIEANIYKLVTGPKARYKGGKYSNAAAQARADKA